MIEHSTIILSYAIARKIVKFLEYKFSQRYEKKSLHWCLYGSKIR